jgi:hypothetical protein
MRVDVTPRAAATTGRTPVVFTVSITNTTEVIAGFTLRVLGLDPAWVVIDRTQLSLFPAMTETVSVTVTPPDGLPAGEQRFAVQVRELTPPYSTAITELDLEIPRAPAANLGMDPRTVTAGRTGSFGLLVENVGNTSLVGRLVGTDEQERIRYRFHPENVDLPPGEHAAIELRVKARRKVFGQPAIRPFSVTVDDGEPPDPDRPGPRAQATFLQRPYLGRGALGLVGLLAAVTVFALVITYALSNVVGRSAADRNLALEVAQAQQQGGTGGSASAAGTVRSLTTGQPIEGVNVAIFTAADTATAIQTTATTKDGSYTLPSLAAGSYKLSFNGAGFSQIWFPASLTDAAAQPVTVQTGQQLTGLDVRVGGLPATISGKVVADSLDGATVTLQVPGSAQPDPTAPVVGANPAAGAILQTVAVGADGTFALANVPSPSVYDLVASEPGFATTTERIDVAGGEDRTGVQIEMPRGDGLISGRVSSAAGPIPGATVTASYQQTTLQTVTLSSGDVGLFTLRSLPTPATFSIVVSAPGFASQTSTLSLTPGQQLTGVGITLGGSSGTLSGKVITADDQLPASGVTVTVTNGTVTLTTVTETTGTPGAWQVQGLPVPSTYTITFARPDLAAQTLSVALDSFGTATTQAGAGTQLTPQGIEVSMQASTAELHGQTTETGVGGVGEIVVTLTNGSKNYTVTSASVPTKFADSDPGNQVGLFAVDRLPPGTYTVTASRNGTRPVSQIIKLTAGEVIPDLVLELAAPVDICGVVEDSANNNVGVAGAQVLLYRAADYPKTPEAQTQTSAGADAGQFCFNDVDTPENYIIEVDYPTAGTPATTRRVAADKTSPPSLVLHVSSAQ